MPNKLYFVQGEAKHVRKSLCIEMKLSIMKHHEAHECGEGGNSIACAINLSQSTVSTIVKNGAVLRKLGGMSPP